MGCAGLEALHPRRNIGPDGASRAFLTDLANLHANTAYLVKLKDDPSTRCVFAHGDGHAGG